MPKALSLIGLQFGRLKVQSNFPPYRYESGYICSRVLCLCTCGNIVVVHNVSLTRGLTLSCGCYARELARNSTSNISHGHTRKHTRSSTYRIWTGMMTRCRNPNAVNWPLYGGRGITICERWNRFENFLADMGNRPIGHSIDRINCNGPYSPENCRWIPKREQAKNRRSNRIFTIKGITGCLSDLANKFGIQKGTVGRRLRYGHSPDEAFLLPVLNNRKIYTVKGMTGCVSQLARTFGIGKETVRYRLKSGASPEEAFLSPVNWKRKLL